MQLSKLKDPVKAYEEAQDNVPTLRDMLLKGFDYGISQVLGPKKDLKFNDYEVSKKDIKKIADVLIYILFE